MVAPLYSELFPDSGSVNSAAHLIQMALTPVFMLSGIGTLINIFNTRLARVSDHLEDVNKRLAALAAPPPAASDSSSGSDAAKQPANDPYYTPERLRLHQARLRTRIFTLDLAIIFCALGGAFTCGAAMALFLGTLRDSTTSLWMLAMFGAALASTVAGLMSFLADTLLSWHGLRREDQLTLLSSLHVPAVRHAGRPNPGKPEKKGDQETDPH
ncbi:DUF2721 domain-containing protein [Oecophyllibacter saccharovorans]|uniref:DUF2721 domain-containing protein n=1 Tax=Oecophyllibacter saccharovorans TaxID=2558360 RepID=UPI001E325BE7|nr:DUF2721 domain-containing protein [Oecophyllibacter saccharovorans]